jgi:hypothetical protein
MATITATVTVNPAFFQEIKQENRRLCDLLTALRSLVAKPLVMKNHKERLVVLLEAVCDQLALHFSLEEAYGYFEDALDVAPRLAERAEQLRSEHLSLFDTIRDIAEEARDSLVRHQMSHCLPALQERSQIFDDDLQRHESLENELIVEATHLDIGVGD